MSASDLTHMHPYMSVNEDNNFKPVTTPSVVLENSAEIFATIQGITADIPQAEGPALRHDIRSLQVSSSYISCDRLYNLVPLKTIVKAKSLSLVGAKTFRVPAVHRNGSPTFRVKHTLPDPIKYGDLPRYGFNGMLYYSPDWSRGPLHNADFIDAVVIAVSAVNVSLSEQCFIYYLADGRLCRQMRPLAALLQPSRKLPKHTSDK